MNDDTAPQYMDCIVVGGVANGLFIRRMRANATFIKLGRPEYVKPLESPDQETPEVETHEDVYEVHPIGLNNSNEPGVTRLIGLAVVSPKPLTWGVMQLILSHVEKATRELRDEALKDAVKH